MAEKIGVYICDGCGIGEALDTTQIAAAVQNKYAANCPVVKTHPALCGKEAQAMIKADLEAQGLDGICACACSPRVKWDIFNYGAPTMVERVNLREQCVWSYSPELGDADKALGIDNIMVIATEYSLMGVVKLLKGKNPTPDIPETFKTLMVLGGGWTGLHAALGAAKAGSEVVLLEKQANLGGKAAGMLKSFPLKHPFEKAEDTGIEALIAEAKANPKIKILTGAELSKLNGAPGLFTAEVATAEGPKEFMIGAVILATGWVPQDTKYLEPLGYGKFKNVMTTSEFEAMAKSGSIKRPSDGKPVKSVAFVVDYTRLLGAAEEACARETPCDIEAAAAPAAPAAEGEAAADTFVYQNTESAKHMAYSSELNSLVALKQAGYVRAANPEAMAFIIYDHMMVPGINERYYKSAQDDPGIMLTKGFVSEIKEGSGGVLTLCANHTLIGEDIELAADIVVLPTGMVPVTAHDPIINLQYRQGPAFPDLCLFDGFADSNYICFPYETRRTGIYAAGCVRSPMTLATCADDAAGAALKAIQCVDSANRGVAVHPRSGDLSFPVFNFVRCTQCKRCTEECPFGALDDDPKGTPMPNPTRCRRCGTCMGACPERVISFDNYNIDMIGSMIREMAVPPKFNQGGPRVLILACENDAYPALDMAALRKTAWSPYVRIIPVRCLGSVNAIWVADAMSKGIDGVMLLGCKYGDDYQCHFVKGSELCNRRKENISETLNRLGVEAQRVDQLQVSIDEYDKIPMLIDQFLEMITTLGPNPFKGY